MLWLSAGLVLWAAAVGLALIDSRNDVADAEAVLRSLTATEDPLDLDPDELLRELTVASEDLQRARERLDRSHVRPLGVVPVIGRQYRSARAMVVVSDDVVDAARPLAQTLAADLDRPPLEVLTSLRRDLARLHVVIDDADLGPSEALANELASARAELDEELRTFGERVGDAELGVAAFEAFLQRSDYVLLGGNNAEMLVGTGMHLSVGRLRVMDGEVTLSDFESSETRFPVTGASVVDADFEANWGFLSPGNDFRKLGYSASFDTVVAPQAIEMWRADRGGEPDGVIALDALVFEALLSVLGPVELEGESFDETSILSYLVFDQYVAFDGVDRELRRDRLGVLAEEVARQLDERSWNPIEMLRALRPLVERGHVRLFDTDPRVQAGWEVLGAHGGRDGNDLGVFLTNLGASKLDPFIDVDIVATTAPAAGGAHDVELEIRITNAAPAGLPSYVVGPWEAIGLADEGAYLGRLVLYLPGGVSMDGFRPERNLEVDGVEGGSNVVVTRLEIAPGSEEVVVHSFRTPTLDVIDLVPTARVPATDWSWDGTPVAEGSSVELP